MEIKDMRSILEEHEFFKGLDANFLDFITGCASNVSFNPQEVILNEGDAADKFYLVRRGKAAIFIAHPQDITIQTVTEGDILGWSWLVPPYKYRFSAKALTNVQAISLDGKCLREKCERNKELGYELLKRLMGIFTERLEATRLQLINIYNQ